MPWNDSGIFQRLFSWAQDAQNNVNIQGARMDQDTNDIVAGLNNCLTRDGQGMPGTAINWNGQRLYNLATPVVAADVANKGYVDTANAVQAKNMAGYQINALGAPTGSGDAATKGYVDGAVVSTSLPGLAGNQGKVLSGTGGGVTWSFPGMSTTSPTITSGTALASSYLFVPVNMASLYQAVTLPDATGLNVGGPQYWMRNYGQFPFEVRDHSGVLIALVPVRGSVMLHLTANATAAGVWAVGNSSEFGWLGNVVIGPVCTDAAATATLTGCAVSATTFVLAWSQGATTGFAVAATVAGTSITYGNVIGIGAGMSGAVSVSPISATTVLVVGSQAGGSSYPAAAVLTLNGTTLSLGASATLLSTAGGTLCACCAMSNTLGMALWNNGSGSTMNAVAFTISGSTIVPGPVGNVNAAVAATVGQTPCLAPISANTALLVGMNSSSSMSAVVVTVSGTAIGIGTPLTSIDSGCGGAQMVSLGGNQFLVTYFNVNTGFLRMVVLTVAGTTVTAGPAASVAIPSNYGASVLEPVLGYTGYVYYSVANAGYFAAPFTINGTSIALGSATQISSTFGSSNACQAFPNVNGQNVLFGATSANQLTAQTVEFVK
jgi:hypothetical protein